MNLKELRIYEGKKEHRVKSLNFWFFKISFYTLFSGDHINKHWDKTKSLTLFIPLTKNSSVLLYSEKEVVRINRWKWYNSYKTAVRVPPIKNGETQNFILFSFRKFL